MMTSFRLQFNKSGFRELRTSAGVKALVEAEAEKVAARANEVPSTTDPEAAEPYYEVQDGTDGERARYRVRTNSRRAARHEAKTQALQRGL